MNDKGWAGGELKGKFTEIMNNLVIAAHTDVVVRLSATLPAVPGYDLVCNVHGVRAEFLAVGAATLTLPLPLPLPLTLTLTLTLTLPRIPNP